MGCNCKQNKQINDNSISKFNFLNLSFNFLNLALEKLDNVFYSSVKVLQPYYNKKERND